MKLNREIAKYISKQNLLKNDSVCLSRIDGSTEIVIQENAPEVFRVEADGCYGAGTFGFGIKIKENSEEDFGYDFRFTPGERKFLFDKTPNYPWFQCMNRGLYRPFKKKADEQFHISLIVDHDIAVLYVDDIALNVRMAEKLGSEVKFYVQNGNVEWRDIEFYEK